MPFVFLAFALVFAVSLWGRRRFQDAYSAEQEGRTAVGITGKELIEKILETRNIGVVEIVKGHGLFIDSYDPVRKRITLAPQHYGGTTYSALGVAAQLAGKVLQHRDEYAPMRWRVSAIRTSLFLSLPVLVVALIALIFSKSLFIGALAVWTLITGYNVVTMPIEMDAAMRAKDALGKLRIFRNLDERLGVEKVLKVAGAAKIEGVFYTLSWLNSVVPAWLKEQMTPDDEVSTDGDSGGKD